MPQWQHCVTQRDIQNYSFTTGVVVIKVASWRIRNDIDALAYALYLERRGQEDEALMFLERYLEERYKATI